MSLKEKILNRTKSLSRKPTLKSPGNHKKILLITNSDNPKLPTNLTVSYPNSELFFLHSTTAGERKQQQSKEKVYTYHKSDVNLTGKIKNDKLNQLLQIQFDLVLDLSDDEPIGTFLIKKLNQSFMIGLNGLKKSLLYDLITQKGLNEEDSLRIMTQHLTLLSQNGDK